MAYNPETMSFELGDNDCDMVYVSGLPPDATEADIAEHFGSIGVVKFDKKQNKHKIWMYRDKMTGAPNGDCTVTYEDPFSASSAVTWFSGKEWKGATLAVKIADKKPSQFEMRGRGRGGGGFGGGPGRDFDGGGRGRGRGRGGGDMGGFGGGAPAPGPPMHQRPPDDFGRSGPPPSMPPPPGPPMPGPPAAAQPYNPVELPGMPAPAPAMNSIPGSAPLPPPPGSQQPQVQQQQIPDSGGEYGGAAPGSVPPQQQLDDAGAPGGQGRGGIAPPKETRDGDWPCPSCGNINFSFRGKCNKCGTVKPGGAGGGGGGPGRGDGGDGGGRGRGRGRGRTSAAPQGPPGLFKEGDWTCPGCGNGNWARRDKCNMCNTPKPGTVDTNREGVGGGFRELDEEEAAEARRRREQFENDDTGMYDDFGRLKKKFRAGADDRKAREAAALARLHGLVGVGGESGQGAKDDDGAKAEREPRSKDDDRDRDRGRDRDRDRDRDMDRDRDHDRDRDRDGDRGRDRDRDRERGSRSERDVDRRGGSRDRDRDRDRDRRGGSRDRDRDRRGSSRDRDRRR